MSRRRFTAALLLVVLLTACGPADTPTATAPLRSVRLLLGFQPDVQFAPFYLAQQAGYFADAGLEVTIEFKDSAELMRLVAAGQAEFGVFGVADATDVMISRTAGIPVKYISTLYEHFPVALIGPAGSVPTDPAELAGLRIGTPGEFGSSWHALLALLDAGGLTRDDVTIRTYPQFNQVDGLLRGDVDLITGFRNNEPLHIRLEGVPVDLLTVDEIAPLPGPGLIIGDDLLRSDPGLAAEFARAIQRAVAAIAATPEIGFEAAAEAVPAIGEERVTALAVLEATIPLWSTNGGLINHAAWESGYETMVSLGFIDGSVALEEMTSDVTPTP
jgi:NitT/TauT family transport system substrate-binding protein